MFVVITYSKIDRCQSVATRWSQDHKPSNKSKRYMLASSLTDSIYDSKNVRQKLKDKNIVPFIAFIIKNTKNQELLKKKMLTKSEKEKYKKRIINENCFSKRSNSKTWINKNRRLDLA